MTEHDRRGVARAAPVLVAGVFLAVYGASRVEVHRFDAVSYMLAAQSAAPKFDPHHLVYVQLAWLVSAAVGPDRMVAAMQAASAVCAAVGLGLYCLLLERLLRRASTGWAIVGAGLLGVSSAFWISAGESDPYGFTLACLIAATLGDLTAVERDELGGHVLAGLAVAAAILVHQLVALYALAYVLGLLLGGVRRPLAAASAFLGPAAGIPIALYLVVALRQSIRDVPGLLYWLTEGAHMGYWGVFRRDNVVEALYGFLYAFAAGAAGLVSPLMVRTVAVAILVVGGVGLARRLRVLWGGRQRPVVALLLAWMAVYVPFIVWWAPYHTVHWQFVLVPLIAVLVWTAASLARRSRAALAAGAAVVVLLGTANYVRVVWPLTVPDNDRASVFVARVLATLPRDARVIAPVGVPANLLAARLGQGSVFSVPHAPGAHATGGEIVAAVEAFAATARGHGHSVWVFANLLEPPQGRLSDLAFKADLRHALDRLRAEGRLAVLPVDLLDGPLRRHPWDVIGS